MTITRLVEITEGKFKVTVRNGLVWKVEVESDEFSQDSHVTLLFNFAFNNLPGFNRFLQDVAQACIDTKSQRVVVK